MKCYHLSLNLPRYQFFQNALVFNTLSLVQRVSFTSRIPFSQDKDDYMGRCIMTPTVRLQGHELPEPRLAWYRLLHGDSQAGQVLAACELFLVRAYMPIEMAGVGVEKKRDGWLY